jgi:hypothetical protein
MRIIKTIETIVNLTPYEMCNTNDISKLIRNKLIKKFEGKCGKNVLIKEVMEITKSSGVLINRDRTDGSGTVNVQFNVLAIVYNVNDILTGCAVIGAGQKNRILCQHEHAYVSIPASAILRGISAKQILTIRIDTVNYEENHEKMTITGKPYIYNQEYNVYCVDIAQSITDENKALLQRKLQQLTEEKAKYQALESERVKLFSDTYYPFKVSWENTKTSLEINIADICKLTEALLTGGNLKKILKNIDDDNSKTKVCLFRPPIIDKISADLCYVSDVEARQGIKSALISEKYSNIVNEDITLALLQLLNDHLSHLSAILEMVELYPTEKIYNEHKNLWSIYNGLKR